MLGSKVVHAGPVGAGHALKALNNLLSATTLLISCEALQVARALRPRPGGDGRRGQRLDGAQLLDRVKLPDYVLPGTFDSGFGLRLMVKDLQTALALADGDRLACSARRDVGASCGSEPRPSCPADADHTEIARWLGSLR